MGNNTVVLFFKNKNLMRQAADQLQGQGFIVQVAKIDDIDQIQQAAVTDNLNVAVRLNKKGKTVVLFVDRIIKIAVPHTTEARLLPQMLNLLQRRFK